MNAVDRAAGSLLICLAWSCGGAPSFDASRSSSELVASSASVLFIGNSLTATQTNATGEDMPAVLSRMASNRSKAFTFQRAIDLGQTLQQSWDAQIPQPWLTGATQWDYIVLQEYSTLPVQDAALFYKTALSTYQAAVQRSLKAGSGNLVLFENWALVNLDPFSTRADYTAALDASYARLSAQLSVPNLIAPLGKAFEKVFADKPQSYLFNPDGKHPNDAAIYLNASMFYGIVFQESPAGLPSLYLPSADAAFLQDVAAQVLEFNLNSGTPDATRDAGVAAGGDAGSDAGTRIADPSPDAGTWIADPSPDAGTRTADPPSDAGTQAEPVALASPTGCASAGVVPAWAIAAGALALLARRRPWFVVRQRART